MLRNGTFSFASIFQAISHGNQSSQQVRRPALQTEVLAFPCLAHVIVGHVTVGLVRSEEITCRADHSPSVP